MNGSQKNTVVQVLEDNTSYAESFIEEDNESALNYLVGQVLAATGGDIGPVEAEEAIKEILGESGVKYPVTFTKERRPLDRATVSEGIAGEIPRWLHDRLPGADEIEDPTKFNYFVEVSVYEDGSLDVDFFTEKA